MVVIVFVFANIVVVVVVDIWQVRMSMTDRPRKNVRKIIKGEKENWGKYVRHVDRQMNALPTDRWTNRPTDQPADRQS